MTEPGPPTSPMVGGRYSLGPMLGQGAMGSVRAATDERLGRPVAVKFLRADLAELPQARRRFEHEARAAARLAHPNVVMVFDSGEDNGLPYLVMERLPGRTLSDDMATAPLRLERVCDIAREVLSALAAAHRAGIIHRDVKPGNVLLTDDGHVKVSDFGIAKTVDADQTQTTELIATPAYLAPERLAGGPASTQSDIYAVGVLLYEALSGQRPFAGDTPFAVMRAVERARPEPLTSLRPDVPAEIARVVERAMSADPGNRFDSADQMAAALERSPRLAATVPIAVRPTAAADTVAVERGSRDGATQVLDAERSQLARPDPPTPRARSRIGLAAVAAVVALFVLVAIVQSRDDGSAGPGPVVTATPTTPAPAPPSLPAALNDAIRKLEQAVAK